MRVSTSALVALVFGISCRVGVAGAPKVVIQGVPRSQLPTYTALYDKNQFQCREGGRVIPFTQVNDDYCDCPDGSDEPGTSACYESRFYCRNKGHVGAYIPSSRVGDSICDCCDGSDEIAGACKDSCSELAKETRAKKAEQIRMVEQGAQKKQAYIEAGQKAVTERDIEYEKLKVVVNTQEEVIAQAKSVKEEAEKQEKEEQEAAKKAQVDKLWATLNADGLDASNLKQLYKQLKGRHGDVVSEVAKRLKEKGGFEDEAPAAPSTPAEDDDAGSDDEQSEGEGDEADQADGEVETRDESGDNTADDVEDVPDEEEVKKVEEIPPLPEEVVELLRKAEEDARVKTEAAEEARSKLSQLNSALGKDKGRLRELEQSRGRDYGTEGELWMLEGKCFSKTINQYEYEMCPFDGAKQKEGSSGTSIGKWNRMEKEGTGFRFFFTEGQKCWNGPERSLTVTVRCGMENEVLSVDEPSVCEYVMDFVSPAACDSAYAKELKLDLEGDDDEEEGPRTEL